MTNGNNRLQIVKPEVRSPQQLGLPAQFTDWRPHQDHALQRILGTGKRFIAMVLPTGAGKSLLGVAAGLGRGKRTLYLTSTKGLQDQIAGDFESTGIVDVRGQNNYLCLYRDDNGGQNTYQDTRIGHVYRTQGDSGSQVGGNHVAQLQNGSNSPGTTCDEGPCHAGIKCDLKEGGCLYFDRVKEAAQGQLIVSNYSFWLHQVEYANALRRKLGKDEDGVQEWEPIDTLILDEAHGAHEELSNYLTVELLAGPFEKLVGEELPDWEQVEEWNEPAKAWLQRVTSELGQLMQLAQEGERTRALMSHIRALKDMQKRLRRLAEREGDWTMEIARRGRLGARVARFSPLWPAAYAERHLFAGAKRVILLSATIRPKTLSLLGISESESEFVEYPSSFPVAQRQVSQVPCVRMDKRNATQETINMWASKIDSIIGQRLDRKGIIHCVSYERCHQLFRNSDWQEYMLLHDAKSTREVVQKFREMEPPAILLSPSLTTGYDFPGDLCRWQVIAKVPFPDTRDKVLQARCERDPEYAAYVTMQTIVQTAGRAVRSVDDWAECFVVDDNFAWFWGKFKKFAPDWFAQAVRRVNLIPKPISFSHSQSQ